MNTRSLDGKVAIVTGGASGIGLGTTEVLIEYGAKVVVGDLQDEKGKALESRFGADTVRYCHCDVTKPEDLKNLMSTAETTFGGLDILFNNAGIGGPREGVEDLDFGEYDKIMDLLLKSVFMGTQFAIPLMKKRGGGVIINTSSVSAIEAGWAPITYSVAKAGVAHFSQMAAAELCKYNIRVNAIRPGLIATSIFGATLGMDRQVSDQMAEMIAQGAGSIQPAGRAGQPRDIAEMVAFLASDAASFITGESITVDGGITVGPPHSWREEAPGPMEAIMGFTGEDQPQDGQQSPAENKTR